MTIDTTISIHTTVGSGSFFISNQPDIINFETKEDI